MTSRMIKHEFVEFIPDEVAEGTVYVSIPYATAVHKCMSGCGLDVVTPLSPTDWELIFDGESISLYPSIGNWSLPCQSHYWIRGNRVVWAPRWSRGQIDRSRARGQAARARYFDEKIRAAQEVPRENAREKRDSLWGKIRTWFSK